MMTPAAVKWLKVSRKVPQSGDLEPVLCFRGEPGMVGLTLRGPVIVVARSHLAFDRTPSYYPTKTYVEGEPEPAPLTPRAALGRIQHVTGVPSDRAEALLRWALLGGYDLPGVLDSDAYPGEEPK